MPSNTAPAAAAVNTKTAPRRKLALGSLDDLADELNRIEAAHNAGTLRTTGNWSAAEILDHVAILMECAVDGFPSKAPAPVRWIITLLYKNKALSGQPMPAGYKIPKQASFLIPRADATFDDAMARLRTVLARVRGSERFNQPSPIFGTLTHDQWTTLQLGHAAGHLSFIDLGR